MSHMDNFVQMTKLGRVDGNAKEIINAQIVFVTIDVTCAHKN